MDNNNANPNTGSKGVFPGSSQVAQSDGENVSGAPNSVGQINAKPITQTTAQVKDSYVETAAKAESLSGVNTYMELEIKNPNGEVSGILKIDLISFRERGQESRYLSINTTGAGPDGAGSDTTISIDNENDFKTFKEFVSNLNWND